MANLRNPGMRNRAETAGKTKRAPMPMGARLDAATTNSALLARQAAKSSALATLAVPMISPLFLDSRALSDEVRARTRRPCRTWRPPNEMTSAMVDASAAPTVPASDVERAQPHPRAAFSSAGRLSQSFKTTLSVASTPKPAPLTRVRPAATASSFKPKMLGSGRKFVGQVNVMRRGQTRPRDGQRGLREWADSIEDDRWSLTANFRRNGLDRIGDDNARIHAEGATQLAQPRLFAPNQNRRELLLRKFRGDRCERCVSSRPKSKFRSCGFPLFAVSFVK